MRNIPSICALAAMLILAAAARGEALMGNVGEIFSGDTFEVDSDSGTVRVKLAGIACPAPDQPFGVEAIEFTRRTVKGRKLLVEIAQRISETEVIGTLELGGGRELHAELLRNGLAWWNPKAAPSDKNLEQLAAMAKAQGLGLWEQADPVAPWEADEKSETEPRGTDGMAGLLTPILIALVTGLSLATGLLSLQLAKARKALVADDPSGPPQSEITSAEIEAVETSKRVIHDLLKSLSESVGDFVDQNSLYSDKVEGYKLSIKKAMTMAGVEQIERLLLRELDEMLATSRGYRRELDKAENTIREQQEVMAKIQTAARMDFLTNIPNRRALEDRLVEEFERARRYSHTFSFVLLDIDRFKLINDTYGHVAGDKVIQVVAHIMQEQVRTSDYVGRFGGEEFAILLPETSARQAVVVADKVRRAVEQTTLVHEMAKIKVTISGGAAEISPEDEVPEEMVKRADSALYKAKDNGRNRMEFNRAPARTSRAA